MNGDDPAPRPRHRPRSVGAIERRGSSWVISAEPHVVILLKRLFLRIDKASDGELRIRSTPEVDRDLEWVRDRFVLDMEPKDERLLHQGGETMRARERQAIAVEEGTFVPREFHGMAKAPRDYQRVAADLCLQNGSLLCADDLGTGKSFVGLTLLSDPKTLPAVLVCPNALPTQWRRMLAEVLPHLRTHILEGTTPYDIPARCYDLAQRACRAAAKAGEPIPPGWPKGVEPDVLILPYTRLLGWMHVLQARATSLIFDEVQELRHSATDKYRAAVAVRNRATYCLGLSATPTANYGGEFYTVLDVIRPGCLGGREEFHREFCVDVQEERKVRLKDPRAFGYYVRTAGLVVRRTRKDVGRELPPLTVIPTPIDADPGAIEAVKHRVFELARTIVNQTASTNFAKMQASGEMDRILRQATGIAKAPHIAAFVRMLVETGEAVLVFAWHRSVYDILKAMLEGDEAKGIENLHPAFYTGDETDKQKREALHAFTSGKTKVLVMSLRSGAGIDGLQHVASTIVIAELDWSPAVHDQAIGRLNRDGQAKPVFAYYLLADKGSDPTVADVCGAKRSNTEPVRNPDESKTEVVHVDPDHVKRLAQAWLDGQR